MSPLHSVEVVKNDSSLKVEAENQDVVLVLSSCPDDASFVSSLLVQSGYLCVTSGDITASANGVAEQEGTGDKFFATVVCYRVTTNVNTAVLCPSKMPGERVIAMTDCSLENTVVPLLESGAHHVFDMRESQRLLQARLEAALRKHSLLSNSSFSLGDIHFDVPKRQVSRGGILVDLSPKEFDLAYYLFCNRDRIVGNSELMTSIWSLPPSMDTRRIDTAACRLRKKLELSANNGWELKRLRRVGYQLVPVKEEVHPHMSSLDAAHEAVLKDVQTAPDLSVSTDQAIAS